MAPAIPYADRAELHRREVIRATEVYRFVHVPDAGDPRLIGDFLSDRSRGKKPLGRAERIPELLDGMSVFRSLATARRRWEDIEARVRRKNPDGTIKIGEYVARLVLEPDGDFLVEDLGDADGHMTIWGNPKKLMAAVVEIHSAKG